MPSLILFDLDGTLVDTAPNLGLALNLQRQRHGLNVLPEATIRPYASHGSKGLLSVGFDLTPEDASFNQMREEYLVLYEEVFLTDSRLFDGMETVLNTLASRGISWGIVTNKPRQFTQPLVARMGLDKTAACVVCGDDAPQPKPHPATLFMACEQAGMAPKDAWYVGDAERDIEAGRAAGMPTVVALYGYLSQDDKPNEWGANFNIHHPMDLLYLLKL